MASRSLPEHGAASCMHECVEVVELQTSGQCLLDIQLTVQFNPSWRRDGHHVDNFTIILIKRRNYWEKSLRKALRIA